MLRRRSVRLRIIVLVLVPVIALIGLYATVLALTLGSVASLRAAASVRDQVTKPLSSTQLQLSAERAIALQYLANPTHGWLLAYLDQEPKTDTAVRRLNAAEAAALPKSTLGEIRALQALNRKLSGLRDLRGTVVSLGLSRAATAAAYGGIIAGGDNVIVQAILPLLDTPGAVQANNLVIMEESLQAAAEERDLFSVDLSSHSYPGSDRRLVGQLIISRRQTWDQAMASLDHVYRKYFSRDIPASTAAAMYGYENQILAGPRSALQIPAEAWMSTANAYTAGFKKGLTQAAAVIRKESLSKARSLVLRLILAGGLGLVAIAAAMAFAVIISRGLLRQFDEFRESAFNLTAVRLPAILARLRSGGEVDLAIETPQLETDSSEIGQLREAINLAAKTAVSAAVDEVAIRRGVNDVFRNLARRNQSLLSRQLELLDAMERRVHDPEELADLFRVDHLTTRMRRHAEGLLIVAGGTSGRSWRNPVPIVDVMRAAVAEIEDYTRIRVSTRAIASIAGHAVADVIHLLAELVENATTFSPANTPVRIESDMVARGLVIEIEDRGLGMGETQLAEINVRLSDPQPLDLSGSEQLGLYIAGRLARRHEVKITLQGSAYGGVIAVVLIPSALVVEAGMEPSGLIGIRELGGRPVPQLPGPAQPEVAIAASASAQAGADDSSPGYLVDLETAATAVTTTAAHIGTGPLTADPLEPLDPGPLDGEAARAVVDPAGLAGAGLASGPTHLGFVEPTQLVEEPALNGGGLALRPQSPRSTEWATASVDEPAGGGSGEPAGGGEPITPMLALGPVTEIFRPADQDLDDRRTAEIETTARAETDFGPVDHSAGSIGAGLASEPDYSTAELGLPVREPADPPADWASTPANSGAQLSATTDANIQGSSADWLNLPGSTPPPGDQNGSAFDDLPRRAGPQLPRRPAGPPNLSFDPSEAFAIRPANTDSLGSVFDPMDRDPSASDQTGLDGLDELPIRVRQANLAPQLREPTTPAQPFNPEQASRYVAAPEMSASPAVPHAPAGEPSPEAARSTMAALQRGWERGRSVAEQMSDQPDGER
jgi:anti-sigma regulatory factor (Ser/Thr protein kinase)